MASLSSVGVISGLFTPALASRDRTLATTPGCSLTGLRVSRDREHGFQCIVSNYFAGS
jgi:hypothetical protein